MSCILFNVENFLALFPAFGETPAGVAPYSTAQLQAFWDMATVYISDQNSGCAGMKPKQQTQALNLMTAHLLTLSDQISKGQTPNLPTASTIDKVSVTLEPPPIKSQWQWWLSLTPYGQQLYALLGVLSVGGIYVGARPELSAFRKAGGVY